MDAQSMEEELQQSVMVSEGDVDETMPDADMNARNGVSPATSDQIEMDANEEDDTGREDEEGDGDDGEDDSESGDEESDSEDDGQDEDPDNDDFEDEADENEEDELDTQPATVQTYRTRRRERGVDNENEDGGDDEDEDEGVGAVKIKPGETEDDSADSASSHSGAQSDQESESEDEWEGLEPEKENDEDESEAADTDLCMFCKQDEQHDPAEEFEVYLSCGNCGENSHQQCARDAGALSGQQEVEHWRCPDCASGDNGASSSENGEEHVNGVEDAETASPSSSRRATAPKLARDLLPPQKGAPKPDSHSVFNHLVLDEDPMDGSRILRKRKTSSAEADETAMSLRKRRKNTADQQSNEGTNGAEETSRPQSSRSLRLKITIPSGASIVKKTRTSLIVKIKVKAASLRKILSKKPKRQKKKDRRGSARSRADAVQSTLPLPALTAPFTSASYSQPFYSFYDKETDEFKGKPYGGILTEAEADTSKTMPTNDDRRRFDEANQKAEEAWRQRLLALQVEPETPALKRNKKPTAPASQIECIEFGGWEIDTWYAAPYPEEYSRNRVLYICEFCLKYMNSDYVAWRHKLKCPAKHPPGDEIYRHNSVSVFEVDGRKNPVYCQNLCLLAKLFLGSKTLYYDVEPFLFYVLCEYDDLGYHFVGYFSKEKRASSQNNVSCILTLPIHQRKGYGNLLIDFSYLLTRVEQKTGSPEKPLSDMGLVSYRNYWRLVMCRYLPQHVPADKDQKRGLSIKQISDETGLTADDVVSALEGLRCLVRDAQTGVYAFRVDLPYCREYVAKWESKKYVQLKQSALTWTPYVMGRSYPANFELGPPIAAIAPREEDDDAKLVVASSEVMTNGIDTADEAVVNGIAQEDEVGVEPTVLESTEPNETGANDDNGLEEPEAAEDVKTNGVPRPSGSAAPASQQGDLTPAEDNAESEWTTMYKDIPTTRFEVFPPISHSRRTDRARSTASRPPAVRIPGTASRRQPGRRRSTGARRSTASKPKSSSKRKSGGTGRGPGRWPKGTKKSDYGNADSGPGLPPGWAERKAALESVATPTPAGKVKKSGGKADKAKAGDTVQVSTPKVKEAKAGSGKRNGVSGGEASASKGRPSPRSHSSSKENSHIEGDVEMEDVDAEAEQE